MRKNWKKPMKRTIIQKENFATRNNNLENKKKIYDIKIIYENNLKFPGFFNRFLITILTM